MKLYVSLLFYFSGIFYGYTTEACSPNGLFKSDPRSPCQYLQCVHGRTLARKCPSGLGVQPNFQDSSRSPCVVHYDECKRLETETSANEEHNPNPTPQIAIQNVQPGNIQASMQQQTMQQPNEQQINNIQPNMHQQTMHQPNVQQINQLEIHNRPDLAPNQILLPKKNSRTDLKQLYSDQSGQNHFFGNIQQANGAQLPQPNFDFSKNHNNNFNSEFGAFLNHVTNNNKGGNQPSPQVISNSVNNNAFHPTENIQQNTAQQYYQPADQPQPSFTHNQQPQAQIHAQPQLMYNNNGNTASYEANIVHQQQQNQQAFAQQILENTQQQLHHSLQPNVQQVGTQLHIPPQQPVQHLNPPQQYIVHQPHNTQHQQIPSHQTQQPASVQQYVTNQQPNIQQLQTHIQPELQQQATVNNQYHQVNPPQQTFRPAQFDPSVFINGIHPSNNPAQQHHSPPQPTYQVVQGVGNNGGGGLPEISISFSPPSNVQQPQTDQYQQHVQKPQYPIKQVYNSNSHQPLQPSIYPGQSLPSPQHNPYRAQQTKAVTSQQRKLALAKLIPFILKSPKSGQKAAFTPVPTSNPLQRKIILAKVLKKLIQAMQNGRIKNIQRLGASKPHANRQAAQQANQYQQRTHVRPNQHGRKRFNTRRRKQNLGIMGKKSNRYKGQGAHKVHKVGGTRKYTQVESVHHEVDYGDGSEDSYTEHDQDPEYGDVANQPQQGYADDEDYEYGDYDDDYENEYDNDPDLDSYHGNDAELEHDAESKRNKNHNLYKAIQGGHFSQTRRRKGGRNRSNIRFKEGNAENNGFDTPDYDTAAINAQTNTGNTNLLAPQQQQVPQININAQNQLQLLQNSLQQLSQINSNQQLTGSQQIANFPQLNAAIQQSNQANINLQQLANANLQQLPQTNIQQLPQGNQLQNQIPQNTQQPYQQNNNQIPFLTNIQQQSINQVPQYQAQVNANDVAYQLSQLFQQQPPTMSPNQLLANTASGQHPPNINTKTNSNDQMHVQQGSMQLNTADDQTPSDYGFLPRDNSASRASNPENAQLSQVDFVTAANRGAQQQQNLFISELNQNNNVNPTNTQEGFQNLQFSQNIGSSNIPDVDIGFLESMPTEYLKVLQDFAADYMEDIYDENGINDAINAISKFDNDIFYSKSLSDNSENNSQKQEQRKPKNRKMPNEEVEPSVLAGVSTEEFKNLYIPKPSNKPTVEKQSSEKMDPYYSHIKYDSKNDASAPVYSTLPPVTEAETESAMQFRDDYLANKKAAEPDKERTNSNVEDINNYNQQLKENDGKNDDVVNKGQSTMITGSKELKEDIAKASNNENGPFYSYETANNNKNTNSNTNSNGNSKSSSSQQHISAKEKTVMQEDIAFQEALTYYSKLLHSLSDFVDKGSNSESNSDSNRNSENSYIEQLKSFSYQDMTTDISGSNSEYQTNFVSADVPQ